MITKQDAENALMAMHPKFDEDGYAWIIRTDALWAIDALPESETNIRCKDCCHADFGGANGTVYCTKSGSYWNEDDYCSRGEWDYYG